MAVSESKERILITIPKEIGDYLKERAQKEHRSLSNLSAALLIDKVLEEKQGK